MNKIVFEGKMLIIHITVAEVSFTVRVLCAFTRTECNNA